MSNDFDEDARSNNSDEEDVAVLWTSAIGKIIDQQSIILFMID